jgi:hypothetical protein
MFYVIGENNRSANAFGEGETIEDAINDWSTAGDTAGAMEELRDYNPRIIRGEQVAIKMEYSFSIVEN